MTNEPTRQKPPNQPESSVEPPSTLRVVLSFAGVILGLGALIFVPAGRLDWIAGWLYLAVFTANIFANYFHLLRTNPELIAYRARFGKYTKTWDIVLMAGFTPVFLAIFVIAGLDAGRFGWSMMPIYWWPLGLVLLLLGTVFLSWSMGVNPFFEKTVRIQTERHQRVIDTGPYRVVRHPGYLGFFGWALSAPFLLGSWWSLIPAALSILAMVVRTALEDRTLRQELPGYEDYTKRTRFRLIPYVW